MKNSSDLFKLVKSLSKSEKRSFKLYAQRYSDLENSSYLQLFDILDKAKVFDKTLIKKKFCIKQPPTQFSPISAYLFDVIMKSLNASHENNSKRLQLKKMLTSAIILKDRGFYDRSKKLLDKARTFSSKYEDFTTLLEIYFIDINDPNKDKRDTLNEGVLILEKIENIEAYRKIFTDLQYFTSKQEFVRKKEVLEEVEKLMSSGLMKSENKALSYTAKQLFCHIKYRYYRFVGNQLKALTYSLKWKGHLKSSPEFLTSNFLLYLSCVHNVIGAYLVLKNYQEVNNTINQTLTEVKTQKVVSLSNTIRVRMFRILTVSKLEIVIITGQYSENRTFVADVEQDLSTYMPFLHLKFLLNIYFNLCLVYFGLEDYKRALFWINKVVEVEKSKMHPEMFSLARLFVVIIYYEMDSMNLISHLGRSTFRYLDNNERLFKSEAVILKYLRGKLVKTKISQEKKIALFQKLKEELLEIFKDSLENNILEYFDFISWIDSKLEGRSYEAVIQEKVNT